MTDAANDMTARLISTLTVHEIDEEGAASQTSTEPESETSSSTAGSAEPQSPLLPVRRFSSTNAAFVPGDAIFGGQVMGQAIAAAYATVPEGRRIHSQFSYFLTAGDPSLPITYEVQSQRDGGSFSARQVSAIQHMAAGPTTILTLTASFQEQQAGLEHYRQAPSVPGPEELPTTADLLGKVDHPAAQFLANQRPIDIRHVEPAIYLQPVAEAADTHSVWMRSWGSLDTGQAPAFMHDCVVAFASDYAAFEPMLRQHQLSWTHPGLRLATINHGMWWHRPIAADEWMLYVLTAPATSGGRGLMRAEIYDQSGQLAITVVQEGMLRLKQ